MVIRWIVLVSPPSTRSMWTILPSTSCDRSSRATSRSGWTRTSVVTGLFGVIGSPGLTHDYDPNLARVGCLVLDRARDLFGHHDRLAVIDLVVHHHDADLSS